MLRCATAVERSPNCNSKLCRETMSALDEYDRLSEMLTADSTKMSLTRAGHEWLAEDIAKVS